MKNVLKTFGSLKRSFTFAAQIKTRSSARSFQVEKKGKDEKNEKLKRKLLKIN